MKNGYLLRTHLFRNTIATKAKQLPAGIFLAVLFFLLVTSNSALAGTAISVTATPHNASNSCNATDGSLTVTASGGNGGGQYLFTISGPNSYTATNFGSSPVTFTGLPAGNYSVTVQDASIAGNKDSLDQSQLSFGNQEGYVNGISEWQSFIVGKTGVLTDLVLGFSTGPGTGNIVSGTGTLSVYSGTGMVGTPLSTQTINISSNNTTPATVYYDSCHLATPVYVAERQVFTFSLTTTTLTGQLWLATGNPYPGACDLVYSGVGNGFGYQWVFKTYVTTPTIFNDGYTGTATATIGATTGCGTITATATAVNVSACDSTNGALTINITGGGDTANSYFFHVSDGSQTASAYGPSGTTIHNLQAGTYSITVEDAAAGGASGADDSVPVGDITPHPVYNSPGSGNIWQSFWADETGSLTQINISFDNNYGDPGYYLTGTLSVYSGIGTGGSLLSTQSGSVTVPGGNNYNHAYADFVLSTPVNIIAGYEYTFQFTPTNRFDTTYYIDQTGSITGGECFESGYITGYAMCFTTYVTPSQSNTSQTVISQTISNTPLNTSVSGNVSVCSGDSVSITASGGNYYSWSPTAGLSCDSCANPVAKPSGKTTYYVTISNGLCSNTDSVVVTVNPLPAPVITAADTIFCSGDSTSLCTTQTFESYNWNTTDTGHCIKANAAGNYYVTVTDANHCSAESRHQVINIYPVPSVSIIHQGDTLSSFGQNSYQWTKNGIPIDSATGQVYVAHQSGLYAVQVTDSNGCTTVSNPVIISGIQDLLDENISIYPNPSAGSWQLTVGNELLGIEMEVYDEQGRLLFHSLTFNLQSVISLPHISPGIYYLRISSDKVSIVRKLIKL